jgi:hypothetical protein
VQVHRLIPFVLAAGTIATAQTAEGYIKIGSNRRELRHARAAQVTDDLHKSKQMIHLILSEAEIPSKALFDRGELLSIKYAKTNQIVEFNFHEDGVNWFLMSKEMEGGGTLSMSHSPNPFPYEIAGGMVKGKIEAHSEGASANQPAYEIAVTYTARMEQAVVEVEVAPTPADAIAAAKSPATRAYLDLVAAMRAGDKAKIMAGVPAEQRAQIDTPQFPQALKFLQAMMPVGLKVLKAAEHDGETTLTLSGTLEGSPQKGEAIMKLDGGKWLMRSESWTNK